MDSRFSSGRWGKEVGVWWPQIIRGEKGLSFHMGPEFVLPSSLGGSRLRRPVLGSSPLRLVSLNHLLSCRLGTSCSGFLVGSASAGGGLFSKPLGGRQLTDRDHTLAGINVSSLCS